MKTDNLFYELFRFDPQSLFKLVNLDIEGDYVFESITTKTTEKRFDGFFKSKADNKPNIFLEIQGYSDKKIYWRLFREICTWYEQSSVDTPFVAIILFLNKKYNPGNCPLICNKPNRLISKNLADCLKSVASNAGVLTVLKPLIFQNKKELPQAVEQWTSDIDSLCLPEDKNKVLIELLEYTILQRFKNLTLEEVRKMIQLTPLEETVAGKELIQLGINKGKQEGKQEGKKEGIQQGELIGKIQVIQTFLDKPVTSRKTLLKKEIKDLKTILLKLEAEMKKS